MDNEAISAFIINALSKGESPDDLILSICENQGLTWQAAEALVKKVQDEKKQVIVKKQLPLLFVLALAIFIGGIGAAGYGCLIIISEFSLIQTSLMNIHQVLNNSDVSYDLYIGLRMLFASGGIPISMIALGIGMILGSLLGMRNVWAEILA
jgi:hypothetical protein